MCMRVLSCSFRPFLSVFFTIHMYIQNHVFYLYLHFSCAYQWTASGTHGQNGRSVLTRVAEAASTERGLVSDRSTRVLSVRGRLTRPFSVIPPTVQVRSQPYLLLNYQSVLLYTTVILYLTIVLL